jgi:KUP system potassium uptake protein
MTTEAPANTTIPHTNETSHMAKLIAGAIGVVFGDIGTSPLYAFKESMSGQHLSVDMPHILSVLSLIFWALLIIVSIKYIIFTMRADNKGEGGSLALMALANRVSKKKVGSVMLIPILGIFAAALFYGDSVITPAISVLSAVEGLQIVAPGLAHWVIPITLTIIAGLFAFQKLGTDSVGKLFGPIMCIWFATIAVIGIHNILDNPSVLMAINPLYAIRFAIESPLVTFLTLGGVVLVLTGGEALYADMGHFGKIPIQIAWTWLVFPALLLNYFGQGAFLSKNPEGLENPFFMMAPEWMLWPLLILATMATIIASQAVISGAFSLTKQAIQLGYLPRMTIVHTSDKHMGQIYLPFINWVLFIFVYILVLTFQTSGNLAHAYGVAVTGNMLITTMLLGVVMVHLWNWKKKIIYPMISLLLLVDAAFFLSTCTKIPHGGWFPLILGTVLFLLLVTWKRGRELVLMRMRSSSMPTDIFFRDYCENFPKVPGTAIYLFNLSEGIPNALMLNLRHNKVLHERNIFLHVSIEEKSYVDAENRVRIVNLGHDFYRFTIRYGFMDEVNVPEVLAQENIHGLDMEMSDISYFIGRETIVPTDLPGMAIWREHLFALMTRNAASIVDYYKLPSQKVIELGSRIDI